MLDDDVWIVTPVDVEGTLLGTLELLLGLNSIPNKYVCFDSVHRFDLISGKHSSMIFLASTLLMCSG